ncbi:MAG: hypothetical protein P794_01700 [Epsilonproteobacteria bacterium (ex Lamellibrachia satsuma)]|nr:MAG: hypothetical protein P794_01700 [Epsilonproteobacteria bacterium (ex Lamellibrachia satsuma)]
MPIDNMSYYKERMSAGTRLAVLFAFTFASFLISPEIFPDIKMVQLILGGLILVSLLYYAFIVYQPGLLVSLRKNVLLLSDMLILMFLIKILEQKGIYFLPVYVLIVAQSSINYGLRYFYSSSLICIASLGLLINYSDYWFKHYDIVIAFGVTALLVPLLSIKIMIRSNQEYADSSLTEESNNTSVQPKAQVAGVVDKEVYKHKIKEMIKKKKYFALLFISIQEIATSNEKDQMENELIQEVVNKIKKNLDTDDFFARLGGNEFVIINTRQRVFLRKYLKKLEDRIVDTYRINNRNIRIEPKIGIALYPEDGQNEMILGKCADEAMREAQKSNVNHMFYRGIKS